MTSLSIAEITSAGCTTWPSGLSAVDVHDQCATPAFGELETLRERGFKVDELEPQGKARLGARAVGATNQARRIDRRVGRRAAILG